MYFLSCHFLPVSRTLSAFTTTTKSPQSAWGVKIGLCLPRRTLAMVVAARPSTLSFTSMTTQLRWTDRLLPITVFICDALREQKTPCGKPLRGGGRYAIPPGVSTQATPAEFTKLPRSGPEFRGHVRNSRRSLGSPADRRCGDT